jgi:hypothetical protein
VRRRFQELQQQSAETDQKIDITISKLKSALDRLALPPHKRFARDAKRTLQRWFG